MTTKILAVLQPSSPAGRLMDCRGEHLFWFPASLNSHVERQSSDAGTGSPLIQRQVLSVIRKSPSPSPVPGLFVAIYPTAILGRVKTIGIDAVERMARRFRPQVSVETFERCEPAIANANAAPAIVRVIINLLVVAALLHRHPGSVFRAATQSMTSSWHTANCSGLFRGCQVG